MKTLYLDIDGMIFPNDRNAAKSESGKGEFDAAVRRAGVSAPVCVGNYCAIAHAVKDLGVEYGGVGILCGSYDGACTDEAWLRSKTVIIKDPTHRAETMWS